MFDKIFNQCIQKKIIHSNLEEHFKKFIPYSGECEYQVHYRIIDRNKPWGVASI